MSILLEMASAGIGCSMADCVLNWLEVVKTKQQLDSRLRPVYPSNTVAVIRQCIAEDGALRGLLFPGLPVTILRSMTYVAFRIGTYPTVKGWLARGASEPSLGARVASGALTGAVGSCFFCPVDIVRTRIMADSGSVRWSKPTPTMISGLRRGLPLRYTTTANAFATIWREEGFRGLYRGARITIARSAVFSSAQLTSYDIAKSICKKRLGAEEGVPLHVACSIISGGVAQTCMQPLDTTRSFLMVGDKAGQPRGYSAVLGMVRQEGWRWFYRGFAPAILRQGPLMLVQWPIIEQIRLLFGLGHF